MKAAIALTNFLPMQSRDVLVVALVSLPTLLLSSLDGCTRGPSLTSIVLTNLSLFV
ncbi:hypothetical protein [Caenimonas sp. SL110]|uniref:hypothetical protein n=1 Tax=Caenimonas sp. SL110 TaxID=1450524 RepID=UPI0013791359|nr:hypothetical protein [Caenimonas sp. SL110]